MCDSCVCHNYGGGSKKWYDNWSPFAGPYQQRLRVTDALGGMESTMTRILTIDAFLVVLVPLTWLLHSTLPIGEHPLPHPFCYIVLTMMASIILFLLVALVVLVGPFLVGAPVWLFMLHVEAWRNHVPTPRNQARWVLDALRDAGKEKQ